MYRKQAEKLWQARALRDYKDGMAASEYTIERRGNEFCVAHYVGRDKVSEDWGGRVLRSDFEATETYDRDGA